MTNPLIIIGMHRSGTSLLTKIIHQAGIHMGEDSNNHNESMLFRKLNDETYGIAHAEWDHPLPMTYLLQNQILVDLLTDKLRQKMLSPAVRDFVGWRRSLRTRSMLDYDEPWGWKDPRNTFTAPIWLRIFPGARVLHIYRHGIDVAASLWNREKHRTDLLNDRFLSARCLRLENAFELWVEYVEMALTVVASLPSTKVFQVAFESFLKDPANQLNDIMHFVGHDISDEKIQSLVQQVRSEFAFTFRGNPNLEELSNAKADHPLMVRLGYEHCETW